VLGAGALAAAGLRSITAKHLALAAQCVGAVMALHPSLTAVFTALLPQTRRAVLLPDFERVLQVRMRGCPSHLMIFSRRSFAQDIWLVHSRELHHSL
jgi:hypothetical protein